jgi:hypothetical protein
MEASQHSLLAACFTLHSINATLAIVPQRGAGLWIGRHKTCMGDMRNARRNVIENRNRRNNFEDLDVDGRIILKWSLNPFRPNMFAYLPLLLRHFFLLIPSSQFYFALSFFFF